MNQLKEKRRREFTISLGYTFEIFCFVSSGLFLLIIPVFSLIFVMVGALIGYWTSHFIEENAVENFKWGLE